MASADPVPSSSKTSRVSPKTVKKAVESLIKWRNSKSQEQKPQLIEEEDFIYLVFTLKKIPPKGRTSPYKVPLPHSLHSEFSEFCLFIDDRTKSRLTKEDAKKKIQSENIQVSKIIKLSKLKSDYRPFEAKRKLCDSYDMFFADNRVIPLLPKVLGKHFFKKKKIPVPLDLKHKNWKEQIEKACSSALLYLGTGTCSVVKVARSSMQVGEIVENVTAAINGIAEIVPKNWRNVRSFHLKLLESVALPIYQALPDPVLKIEGKVNEEEATEEKVPGEANKLDVSEEGRKERKVTKKKGRNHEVRYMDYAVQDELGSDDDNDTNGKTKGVEGKKSNGEKKRKPAVELNSEKRLKKSAALKSKEAKVELGTKKRKDPEHPKLGEFAEKKDKKAGLKKLKAEGAKAKGGETKLKTKGSKKAV